MSEVPKHQVAAISLCCNWERYDLQVIYTAYILEELIAPPKKDSLYSSQKPAVLAVLQDLDTDYHGFQTTETD